MNSDRTLMYAEAAEAASVVERQNDGAQEIVHALGESLRRLDPPFIITCARGSSDHAATYAKYLIETRVRTPVASFAPSTASLCATPWRPLKGVLFLAISQSGRSPDILISARAARDAGALVVAIVNDSGSPLAELAEVTIPMLAGAERSVAATKSFLASLSAILRLVAHWTAEEDLLAAIGDLPQILRRAWALDWTPAISALSEARNLFAIGRGLSLAIAQEAALKLKETSGIHAEAFSAAEVRHGPMALVEDGFPVLMLEPSDAGREDFEALARGFIERGAKVILVGSEQTGALSLPCLRAPHPAVAPIATIQSFYRLANALSVERGFDPDRPRYLNKVTKTR